MRADFDSQCSRPRQACIAQQPKVHSTQPQQQEQSQHAPAAADAAEVPMTQAWEAEQEAAMEAEQEAAMALHGDEDDLAS